MRIAASITTVLTSLLQMCQPEEIGGGTGSIQVHNEDGAQAEVLISDNSECMLGTQSSVESNTTRVFDVGEASWLCTGGRGIPVEDGGSYVIEGGAARPETHEQP